MSNGLEKSTAIAPVPLGGQFSVNPEAIWWAYDRSTVVVEYPALKPSSVSARWMCGVMRGGMSLFKSLQAGHRTDISRYEVPCSFGLSGFSRGRRMACFQIAGRRPCAYERLNILHRYRGSKGPRCFSWSFVMPSVLRAVEFPLAFRAALI